MSRPWKILLLPLFGQFWEPATLIARAAALAAIFGLFHLVGMRDATCIFSGTSLLSFSTAACGMLYAAAWFGVILVCPVLLLTAGISILLRRALMFDEAAAGARTVAPEQATSTPGKETEVADPGTAHCDLL